MDSGELVVSRSANAGLVGIGQIAGAADTPCEPEATCLPWDQSAIAIDAWDELARSAAEPNPFLESWFLLPALEALDPDGSVSLFRLESGGELLGLLPLVRQFDYYGRPIPHLASWIHPNCFMGTPLVLRGNEARFWQALIGWADDNPGTALFLHLTELALDSSVHAGLVSVLESDGRTAAMVRREERAMLASDLEPDDYLREALSQRKRKDLNRRFRKLSELGEVRFEWASGTRGLSDWTDHFLRLEASGWKGDAGSALACDPQTRRMFSRSLAGAAERERLVRLSLLLDDQPIAMLSTFVTPPGSFGFKTAFDEAYSRFSPGFLLEREYLNFLEREDVRWCDSCAAPDHSVMNQIWNERRTVGGISLAIGGRLRRATFEQLVRLETTTPIAETQK